MQRITNNQPPKKKKKKKNQTPQSFIWLNWGGGGERDKFVNLILYGFKP